MKHKISLFLLLTLFSSAFASANETCYPFKSNEVGYSKICIQILSPDQLDSEVLATIYQDTKVAYRLKAYRKYFPTHLNCSGKEHDCRKMQSELSIITAMSNHTTNEITVYIRLWQQEINKCYAGRITIANRPHFFHELFLKCPRTWWENI